MFFNATTRGKDVIILFRVEPEDSGTIYDLDVYQAYSFLEELVNATSLAIQNKIKEN